MTNKSTSTENHLASTLLYLPLPILSRVELWLTYKYLKPVSAIDTRSPLAQLSLSKRNKITKWISLTKLHYATDHEKSSFIHVSKNPKLAEKSAKILFSSKKKDIIQKGRLFGYPAESSTIFACLVSNGKSPASSKELIFLNLRSTDKTAYWKLYALYAVRKNHKKTDTEIAKQWANMLRKDVPRLAQWYEKAIRKT